jgi:hypothetical protein
LYEQSRQILMVRIDKFGPIADQHRQLPVGDPVLASALDMMKEIADRYAKGSIERQGLSDARGQMLRAMGLEMRKRPAACDEEPKMAPMKRATTDEVKSRRALKRPAAKSEADVCARDDEAGDHDAHDKAGDQDAHDDEGDKTEGSDEKKAQHQEETMKGDTDDKGMSSDETISSSSSTFSSSSSLSSTPKPSSKPSSEWCLDIPPPSPTRFT